MNSSSSSIGPGPLDGRKPLYRSLQHLVRQKIDAGDYPPGHALPSERELCERLNVSRVTVRKAIGGLVAEGRLKRVHGSGTFVIDGSTPDRIEKNFAKLSSFSEDMLARGLTPSSIWVSRSEGAVTPNEGLALALSPGSRVFRFRRVRLADGEPMALEASTIPAYCLPSLEVVDTSLYTALRQAGFAPERALQRLRAEPFVGETAALLDVPEKHPGLLIERRGFLRDGRAVEYTLSSYRGDRYDFITELNLG